MKTKTSEKETEDCVFLTIGELKKAAKDCIKAFFLDKKTKRGEEISHQLLFSPKSVRLVLNTTIVEAVDRVHKALDRSGCGKGQERVVSVLEECAKRWIPKDFAGGIMIMYFALCEGMRI